MWCVCVYVGFRGVLAWCVCLRSVFYAAVSRDVFTGCIYGWVSRWMFYAALKVHGARDLNIFGELASRLIHRLGEEVGNLLHYLPFDMTNAGAGHGPPMGAEI